MRTSYFFGALGALFVSVSALAQDPAPSPAAPPVITVPPPPIVMAPPAPQAPAAKPRIGGASVYVYSFLDVRKDEFGGEVLAQFHQQMLEALKKEGVKPDLQLFASTTAGALWMPSSKPYNGSRVYDSVPVVETVFANLEREKAAGSRYRLLILPAEFDLIGAWRHYTVRWILMDTATDQIVWRHDYKGKHLTVWRVNENAVGRGRKLTEGGLAKMREDKII